MPTGEETEIAISSIEDDFPDEAAVIRRRLIEISEERPMHSWLREVVEALSASTTSTSQMRETLEKVVPGIESLQGYLRDIRGEEIERTRLAEEENKRRHDLAIKEADTYQRIVDGMVTAVTASVKHPGFWALLSGLGSAIATWMSITYGFPLME